MTNIDYVTFPTAKLLKEAGYPQKACRAYDSEGDILDMFSPVTMDEVAAPHLWDAMKWLREEKRISVEVVSRNKDNWRVIVDNRSAYYYEPIKRLDNHPTYEQACDAGIAAACEWLISRAGNKNGTLSPNPSETDENHPKKALNFRLTDLLTTLMSPPKLSKNHSEKE